MDVPLHSKDLSQMEKPRDSANKTDGKCGNDDVNDLVGYIKQLELSLANKDKLLAARDQRIGALEAEVSVMKKSTSSAAPFRATVADEAETPRDRLPGREPFASSTPNQVSDDSGVLSRSLSHISEAHSADDGMELPTRDGRWDIPFAHSPEDDIEQPSKDGRWNIPFDESFEGLAATSPSCKGPGRANALRDISGFVPISREGQGQFYRGTEVTPVRPAARSYMTSPMARAIGLSPLSDKENVSPKSRGALGLNSRDVR